MISSFIDTQQRDGKLTSSLLQDRRGISTVEAILAIPFFIVIWMALIFLHHTFVGRLEAQVAAHNTAFSGAMVGRCNGKKVKSDSADTTDITNEMGRETTNDQQIDIVDQANRSTSGEDGGSSLFDWSHFLTSTSIPVSGIPKPFGGPEKTVEGQAKVMCNMKPRDGLGDSIYDMLKGNF